MGKEYLINGALSGRVNVPSKLLMYEGKETDTAITSIDNKERKISVDVKIEEVTKDCATKEDLNNKQDKLISGENIKTINGESILSPGNIEVATEYFFDAYDTVEEIYNVVGEKAFLFKIGEDGRHIGSIYKGDNNYQLQLWGIDGYKTASDISGDRTLDSIWYDAGDLTYYALSDDVNELNDRVSDLESDVTKLDERVTSVEDGIRIYNYFYYDSAKDYIEFPLTKTKYTIRELSSKGVLSDSLTDYEVLLVNGRVSDLTGRALSDADGDIPLYQTGLQQEILTDRYGYDNIDIINGVINRYCYPITFRELFELIPSTSWTWSGSGTPNGRLSVRHDVLNSVGIYTENGISPKYTKDIGLTYRGISNVNFAIDNLKSIEGITNKATAISTLSSDTYSDFKIIFKRTEPITESFSSYGLSFYSNEIDCDGETVVGLSNFKGCAQVSYLSLKELVYSKDQADDKFLTKEVFNKSYTSNDHIVKIGDLNGGNKLEATLDIYSKTLKEFGYPKVASAVCIEPTTEESGEEIISAPFRGDTIFINSRNEGVYGYIAISQAKTYWITKERPEGSEEDVDIIKQISVDPKDIEITDNNISLHNIADPVDIKDAANRNYVDKAIENVEIRSDVIDVIGTYIELQSYDTSEVRLNDLIKVISDETHNNAASYYRWEEISGINEWAFVASEGPYYTKFEADDKFINKTTMWYGTQAEYDALGTYDNNTIYNILES